MSNAGQAAVLLEMRGPHIALVTINRVDAHNAINGEVAEGLECAVDRVEASVDLRVAVITGAGGRTFSAGADLKEVSRGNLGAIIRERTGFAGFVHATRTKPWIAAVEGLALAGGCEIALACDIIIASENGAFGLPEVTVGLAAAAGGLYRLPRALPRTIAIELILTADRLPATRAAELGMVNHLAPVGRTVEVALSVAEKIAANAPLAVSESLRVAKQAMDLDDASLRLLSDEAQVRLSATEDFREGPLAFIQKRPPRWRGR